MVQRIQSVWLLLVAIFAVLTFKLPCYTGTTTDGKVLPITATATIPLLLVSAAITVLALTTIFMYKKRPFQLRLCILGIMLQLLAIFFYYRQVKTLITGDPTLWSILYGAIPFLFAFAARAIYKDEKMIKESDRLR